MLKIKIIVLLLVFAIALAVFSFYNFFTVINVSEFTLVDSYSLPFDFAKVKMVLVRNDVMEEIIAHEHGEIIEKKWNKFVISGDRPFRDGVDIEGSGDFLISKQEPDAGKLLLKFKQQISLTKSSINSVVKLIEPVGYIKAIETTMEVCPQEKETFVKTRIHVKYERLIPKNMVEMVNKKVKESVSQTLATNKEVVSSLVEKYADKKFIFPVPLFKKHNSTSGKFLFLH